MIILAHVGPPAAIFQLRNFDVPLMVMVAGTSFGISYHNEPYGTYLWKRINRLVFPVWIFLTIYFLMLYITGFPTTLPNVDKIVTSYLLLSGIGYVWIIRIFLLVALVSPIICLINSRTSSNARYLALTGTGYLLYELLLVSMPISDSFAGRTLESTLLYVLPYSFVFAIGLRLPSLTKPQIKRLCLGAVSVFILIGGALYFESGKFIPTQNFKYPPKAYYLSFALAVSLFLWLISDRVLSATIFKRLLKPIAFIAQNSIWIYLWHIPMVEMIHLGFFIKFPTVFLALRRFHTVDIWVAESCAGTLA
jgi:hypothetical protein